MRNDYKVIEEAFKVAREGGWEQECYPTYDEHIGTFVVSDGDGGYVVPSIIEILYNHEFADALWGEQIVKDRPLTPAYNPVVLEQGWRYHLQQMVIAEDPIQYLKENM